MMEREKAANEEKESPEFKRKKVLKYQIYMFFLCYILWIGVHVQREFWAMSKRSIKEQNPDLSMRYFAAIDTSLFQTYSFAQFLTGAIGDAYPRRKVLSLSFTI